MDDSQKETMNVLWAVPPLLPLITLKMQIKARIMEVVILKTVSYSQYLMGAAAVQAFKSQPEVVVVIFNSLLRLKSCPPHCNFHQGSVDISFG